MTPLRQRMIEDMQLRNLSTQTQRAYLHYITGLARFYQTSPEHLSLEEIREYQLYLIQRAPVFARVGQPLRGRPPSSSTTSRWKRPGRKALCRAAACRTNFRWSSAPTEVDEFFQHVSPFAIAPR